MLEKFYDILIDLKDNAIEQSLNPPRFHRPRSLIHKTTVKQYLYCPKIIFLRHVQKISPPASEEMVSGRIYHQAMAELYPTAKRLIYTNGLGICTDLAGVLMERLPDAVVEAEEQMAFVGKSINEQNSQRKRGQK